jgi:hypothetical protein
VNISLSIELIKIDYQEMMLESRFADQYLCLPRKSLSQSDETDRAGFR